MAYLPAVAEGLVAVVVPGVEVTAPLDTAATGVEVVGVAVMVVVGVVAEELAANS